jgi:hypothetical protein
MIFVVAGVVLLTAWLIRRRWLSSGDVEAIEIRDREETRITTLPEGLESSGGDPWNTAVECRARGDLSGAVIRLFAHQLQALDREGLIQLARGRTGRQYVRTTTAADQLLGVPLEATLRLFEQVYYGRKAPSPVAFNRVWELAVSFEQRLQARRSGTP